jgi:hypothetical protein
VTEARRLAGRQAALAREARALDEGKAAEVVEAKTDGLSERMDDFAEEAGALGFQTAHLTANRPPAQAAQGLAASAERIRGGLDQREEAAAGRAAKGLPAEPASLAGVSGPMRDSVSALDQLRQALPARGAGRAGAAGGATNGVGLEAASALVGALDAASRAYQTGDAEAAASAVQFAAEVAQAAAGRARAMNLRPGATGGGGTGMYSLEPPAAELKKMGLQVSDWFRLPGELRDEVMQAAPDAGPEEYRSLIKRYFRDLAVAGREDGTGEGR